MLILGVSGGIDPIFETSFGRHGTFHDTAAVLLRDGAVIAGIEEERLNRIKHTNKVWARSLKFCLDYAGVALEDIDCFAIYADEAAARAYLQDFRLRNPGSGISVEPRELIQRLFEHEIKQSPDPEKFRFVHHHRAHALSAYAISGFDSSVVLTIDGVGDNVSTRIFDAEGQKLTLMVSKQLPDSLGYFYLGVIQFLGYKMFDEYKVMGLAPYGDPLRFQKLFSTFYSLLPNGDYAIHFERIRSLHSVLKPRRRDEPFEEVHKDLAAALQGALESIVFHMVRHFKNATRREYLCLAGGVAQNSTLAGKILSSGLFRDVFVAPAAYDAGCALGAALDVAWQLNSNSPRKRAQHVYWGSDAGDQNSIRKTLDLWSSFVSFRQLENCPAETARVLADGKVIGWIQGRSEFGPRALGNRSILADPRPAIHKELINAMIKEREAYRPFAPSVLEEQVDSFFEVPGTGKEFPFMSFVLSVRENMRGVLGAVTHVDGTARVQTVSKNANPKYWQLISEFGQITGIPILLNTSFNNNVEPIVDTVEDAVICFLTSGLHYLVAGDFLVEKNAVTKESLFTLVASLSKAVHLVKEYRHVDHQKRRMVHTIVGNWEPGQVQTVSPEMYELLCHSGPPARVGDILALQSLTAEQLASIGDELFQLWSKRRIQLRPFFA